MVVASDRGIDAERPLSSRAQALGDLQPFRRSPARVAIRSVTRFQAPRLHTTPKPSALLRMGGQDVVSATEPATLQLGSDKARSAQARFLIAPV